MFFCPVFSVNQGSITFNYGHNELQYLSHLHLQHCWLVLFYFKINLLLVSEYLFRCQSRKIHLSDCHPLLNKYEGLNLSCYPSLETKFNQKEFNPKLENWFTVLETDCRYRRHLCWIVIICRREWSSRPDWCMNIVIHIDNPLFLYLVIEDSPAEPTTSNRLNNNSLLGVSCERHFKSTILF